MTSDDLFTPEQMELAAYFAQPQFDGFTEQIGKIMQVRPDLLDRKLIANAAAEMLMADDEAVTLSPEDAVRLAKRRSYMSAESAAKLLNVSGIDTLADLEKIVTKALDSPREPGSETRNPDAEERAGQLRYYAEKLAKNKDIILLGLPVFWPEMNSAWVKLAVLGGELSAEEQDIVIKMRDIADEAETRIENGIFSLIFRIKNIHG